MRFHFGLCTDESFLALAEGIGRFKQQVPASAPRPRGDEVSLLCGEIFFFVIRGFGHGIPGHHALILPAWNRDRRASRGLSTLKMVHAKSPCRGLGLKARI